jgi:hypothetical protein
MTLLEMKRTNISELRRAYNTTLLNQSRVRNELIIIMAHVNKSAESG